MGPVASRGRAAVAAIFKHDDDVDHHGIKGQRWGVRRTKEQREAARTEDAKSADAAKTKAKKLGVDSLSNKELQALTTRMNLEQQYSRLSTAGKTKSAGQKFIEGQLKQVAQQQIAQQLPKLIEKGSKAFAA